MDNYNIGLESMSDPSSVYDNKNYKEAVTTRRSLLLNLTWICLIWVFTFTAYSGLQNLEAALHPDIGVYSLAAITGGGFISCIVAPALIGKIGAKGALILSWVCLAIFVGSNYYPKHYILLPGSAIEGLSTGLMWTAQGAFLTTIAMEYSEIIGEGLDSVLSRFFGIFCMAFQSTQIWGNVISSAVFTESGSGGHMDNVTHPAPSFCGASDCPWDNNSTSPAKPPEKWRVDLLISIYMGFTVIGMLITIFLLKPIKSSGPSDVSIGKQLGATLRLLFTDLKMALLIPMSIWTGMEQVILFAEFTRTYAGCELGVSYIGFTMICFGVVNTLGSPLSGVLSKYIGRMTLCWIATCLNVGILALMRFWTPDKNEIYVFFIIPGVWGLGDAIWQTQSGGKYLPVDSTINRLPLSTKAMVGSIFSNNQEPAYANLRLFQALGFTMAYLYSNSLCMYIKLYIAGGFVVFAVILQTIVDLMVRNSESASSVTVDEKNIQY